MERSFPRLASLPLALALIVACASAQEEARAVADGGVKVAGWTGQVDPGEASRGQVITNARMVAEGQGFRVTTGPASVFWNPANSASGDYVVKATFHEPEYMKINDHPHPYGIVIGGSDMGTADQRYLYCAAYGNGTFIVRGFGPAPFQVNGRRGEASEAVHQAAGKGQPVTQEIAVAVQGDEVTCTINGTVVGRYPKADIVGEGKLASTDGIYGVRFAHNTDAIVTGFGIQ
ncbi:MAG TPA: hypothetical protein PLL69_04720 [Gemmatimonadales bacterium]|nr:hypothetical protein [Gemmatimonadales bacterium]